MNWFVKSTIEAQKVLQFPTRLAVPLLTVCVFLAFSSTHAAAQVGSWTTGSITTNGDTNNFVAVTTDSSGSFFGVWRPESGTAGYIEIGAWNGTSWTKTSSFNMSSDNPNIFESLSDDVDLAVDSTGNYHVAFKASRGDATSGPRGVFYAKYDGSSWTFEEVQTSSDSSGWKNYDDPRIDVDSSGNPHMTYCFSDVRANPRMQYIRYAARSTSWTITNVDTLSGGDEIDNGGFALDSSNKAHLSYCKENGDSWDADLMYATNSSGSFVKTVLKDVGDGVSDGPGVGDTDLELDGNGKVHISYSVGTYDSSSVRHVTNAGGSFAETTAVSDGDHGSPNAIGVNSNANLKVIVYKNNATDPSSVRAATKDGSDAWQNELIWHNTGDDFGTGSYLDVAMNGNGDIMVLFHRNSDDTGDDRRVMFAFGTMSTCTPTAEICDNGVDDDCDGNADCADSDCGCNVTCDNTNPTITCPANITVNNEPGTCGAVVNYIAPVGTDNCSGATTTRTAGLGSGATFPVGTTTETYTVTDAAGNTAECSFTVTVVDNEDPTISCPANITVNHAPGTCGAVVNYTAPVGTDNCSGATTTTRTAGLGSGATFPVGTTTETYTVTDASGNTATCSFDITVVDNEDPVISCPANITMNSDPGICGAVVNYTAPVGTDNCPEATTALTAGLGDGATFPIGTTTETYTVTDASGNDATCSFDVTVVDNEDPVISVCPANISQFTDPGNDSAIVDWTAPTATDNCLVNNFVSSHNPGDVFPLGATAVSYAATDSSSNMTICNFLVMVTDNESPEFSDCPLNIVQSSDPGLCTIAVTWTPPTVTDNVGVTSLTSTHNPGDTFDLGETTVTYTAEDNEGNTSVCTFIVTVEDKETPVITTCPDDRTISADANCEVEVPDLVAEVVATDHCDTDLTITQEPAAGTVIGLGDTEVTTTVEDDGGNKTTCTVTITVIDDIDPTIITCPDDRIESADANCETTVPNLIDEVVAEDNCDADLTITQNPPANAVLVGPGDTLITITVTDDARNSTTCTVTLTVRDSDSDGQADGCDQCPADANKVEPGSCGCGTPDTDTDGDGTADCNDNCPDDPNKTEPGICDCGTPDTDTDGDGTSDCDDNCPDDPNKAEPGACDCGTPDTDTDDDGTADCNDNCPDDPDKVDPGDCGCGNPETDSDSDLIPDCEDQCPDDPNKVLPGLCGCGAEDTPDCLPAGQQLPGNTDGTDDNPTPNWVDELDPDTEAFLRFFCPQCFPTVLPTMLFTAMGLMAMQQRRRWR